MPTACTLYNLRGVRVLACDPREKKICDGRDAIDLIAEAYERRANLILLPVERLDQNFFALETGLAGAIVQKFAQYGLSLAVVGDVSRYADESASFRDFVRESNRRNDIWFVATADELQDRLARARHPAPGI
jgi:Domain of unknown function (DUF4180)